jgi:ribonucleotide reductase alpha subunit
MFKYTAPAPGQDLRLSTISTGLIVPSKFFDLAKEGKDFYMFAPHTFRWNNKTSGNC